mgnify:CR=1 FL=1
MNKEQIINELLKLKDKEVIAIIDEGRARKREERGIIRGIYDSDRKGNGAGDIVVTFIWKEACHGDVSGKLP